MRDLTIAIDNIIKEIPADYIDREQVVSELLSIRSSYQFASPENEYLSWERVTACLNDNFLPVLESESWKYRIGHILAGNVEKK